MKEFEVLSPYEVESILGGGAISNGVALDGNHCGSIFGGGCKEGCKTGCKDGCKESAKTTTILPVNPGKGIQPDPEPGTGKTDLEILNP